MRRFIGKRMISLLLILALLSNASVCGEAVFARGEPLQEGSCLPLPLVHSGFGNQVGLLAQMTESFCDQRGIELPQQLSIGQVKTMCQDLSSGVVALAWMVKEGKFDWIHALSKEKKICPEVRQLAARLVVKRRDSVKSMLTTVKKQIKEADRKSFNLKAWLRAILQVKPVYHLLNILSYILGIRLVVAMADFCLMLIVRMLVARVEETRTRNLLCKLGQEALPFLCRLLRNPEYPHPGKVVEAIHCIGPMPALSPREIPDLRRVLHAPLVMEKCSFESEPEPQGRVAYIRDPPQGMRPARRVTYLAPLARQRIRRTVRPVAATRQPRYQAAKMIMDVASRFPENQDALQGLFEVLSLDWFKEHCWQEALKVLGQICAANPSNRVAVDRMAQALADSDSEVHVQAVAAFVNMGSPAVPYLVEILEKASSPATARAEAALVSLWSGTSNGELDKHTREQIGCLIRYKDQHVRKSIHKVLFQLGGTAVPVLQEGVHAEKEHIRHESLLTLANLYAEMGQVSQAIELLTSFTEQACGHLSRAAVGMLEELCAQQSLFQTAMSMLVRALGDGDSSVRTEAKAALCRIGMDAVPLLQEVFGARSSSLAAKVSAADTLFAIDDQNYGHFEHVAELFSYGFIGKGSGFFGGKVLARWYQAGKQQDLEALVALAKYCSDKWNEGLVFLKGLSVAAWPQWLSTLSTLDREKMFAQENYIRRLVEGKHIPQEEKRKTLESVSLILDIRLAAAENQDTGFVAITDKALSEIEQAFEKPQKKPWSLRAVAKNLIKVASRKKTTCAEQGLVAARTHAQVVRVSRKFMSRIMAGAFEGDTASPEQAQYRIAVLPALGSLYRAGFSCKEVISVVAQVAKEEKDPIVQRRAFVALRDIGPASLPLLRDFQRNDSDLIRLLAIQTLGQICLFHDTLPKAAKEAIVRALTYCSKEPVAYEAAKIVQRMELPLLAHKDIIEGLVYAVDSSEECADAVIPMLRKAGESIVPLLVSWLDGCKGYLHKGMLRILQCLEYPKGVPEEVCCVLEQLLETGDKYDKRELVATLQMLAASDKTSARLRVLLLKAAQDKEEDTRVHAVGALKELFFKEGKDVDLGDAFSHCLFNSEDPQVGKIALHILIARVRGKDVSKSPEEHVQLAKSLWQGMLYTVSTVPGSSLTEGAAQSLVHMVKDKTVGKEVVKAVLQCLKESQADKSIHSEIKKVISAIAQVGGNRPNTLVNEIMKTKDLAFDIRLLLAQESNSFAYSGELGRLFSLKIIQDSDDLRQVPGLLKKWHKKGYGDDLSSLIRLAQRLEKKWPEVNKLAREIFFTVQPGHVLALENIEKSKALAVSYYQEIALDLRIPLDKRMAILQDLALLADIQGYACKKGKETFRNFVVDQTAHMVSKIMKQGLSRDISPSERGMLIRSLVDECKRQVLDGFIRDMAYGRFSRGRAVSLVILQDNDLVLVLLMIAKVCLSPDKEMDFSDLNTMRRITREVFHRVARGKWRTSQECRQAVGAMILFGKGVRFSVATKIGALFRKNRALIRALCKKGVYARELWTKGLEIRSEACQKTRGQKEILNYKKQVYETVFDTILPIVEKLAGTEDAVGDVAIGQEVYPISTDQLFSIDSDELFDQYVASIKELVSSHQAFEEVWNTQLKDRFREIESEVEQFSNPGKDRPEECRACIGGLGKFFREITVGNLTAGCYKLGDSSQEMPFFHASEGDVFFVQITNKRGRQIANAVVVATDKGMIVYRNYQIGNLDLAPVYARLFAELVWQGQVFRVFLGSGSAGFKYVTAKKWASSPGAIGQATKPQLFWREPYYDEVSGFSRSTTKGITRYSLSRDAICITKESLQKAGYCRQRASYLLPKLPRQASGKKDAVMETLGFFLSNKSPDDQVKKQYMIVKKIIGVLKKKGELPVTLAEGGYGAAVQVVKSKIRRKQFLAGKKMSKAEADKYIAEVVSEMVKSYYGLAREHAQLEKQREFSQDAWRDPYQVLGWGSVGLQLWSRAGLEDTQADDNVAKLMKRCGVDKIVREGDQVLVQQDGGGFAFQGAVVDLWSRTKDQELRKAIEAYIAIGKKFVKSKSADNRGRFSMYEVFWIPGQARDDTENRPRFRVYYLLDQYADVMSAEKTVGHWYQLGLVNRSFAEEYIRGEHRENEWELNPEGLQELLRLLEGKSEKTGKKSQMDDVSIGPIVLSA